MGKKTLLLWMCMITFLAGAINAISVFGYDGMTVSHLTGLVTKIAINIAELDAVELWEVLRVVLAFFAGAVISGFITGERAFYLKKRYGYIILSIGVLMFVPYYLPLKYDILLFAFIMGLENGMVVSFQGVVVRMTHMSGNVTDLGVYVGYKLKRNKNERLITGLIPFMAITSFIIGGIIGVLSYKAIQNWVFTVMAVIYILLAILYFVLRSKCNDKNFNDIPDHLEEDNTIDIKEVVNEVEESKA